MSYRLERAIHHCARLDTRTNQRLGELPIQRATAESNFFERNTDLNAGDIVVDGNERLAPGITTSGDQLVNVVGCKLDPIR